MPKKHRQTFTFNGKTLDRVFSSKAAANEWYSLMKKKAERVKAGLPMAADDLPVKNAAAKWMCGREQSADYWMKDNAKMREMVPRFGEKTIQGTTKGDCELVLHGVRKERGLSGATFNRYRACLHTFFEYCIDEGHRETNPVTRIERMPELKRGAHVPDESVNAYLAYLCAEELPVYFAFLVLAMNTGCRPGELAALTLADYQPSTRRMEIRRRFQRDLDQIKEGTKGGAGRFVPLNDFAIAAIEAYLPHVAVSLPDAPLFQREDGSCISLDTLRNVHERARAAAGLPDQVRLYDITRHKFASAVTQTFGIRAAQELLGHSTSAITERYAHAEPGALINRVVDVVVVGSGTHQDDGKNMGEARDLSQTTHRANKKDGEENDK